MLSLGPNKHTTDFLLHSQAYNLYLDEGKDPYQGVFPRNVHNLGEYE